MIAGLQDGTVHATYSHLQTLAPPLALAPKPFNTLFSVTPC